MLFEPLRDSAPGDLNIIQENICEWHALTKRGGQLVCTYFDENFFNFVPAHHTVSILGVYKDGQLSSEAWGDLGPRISPALGAPSCDAAYGGSLLAGDHALSTAIADYVRGLVDGHIVLDRRIAELGRYPPINPLSSLSRLAPLVWSAEERTLVVTLRTMIARYEETSDLRLMGGYVAGSDPELDKAVEIVPKIYTALKQSPSDAVSADAFREVAQALAH